jgi:hypothetical protein
MSENSKSTREYFEKGCLCIAEGNISKKPASVDDNEAATYYENNCKCSRNYKHLEQK